MDTIIGTPTGHCYIGLGSNLDNPKQQILSALEAIGGLSDTTLLRRSRLYQSKAIGPPGQPDYINSVCEIRTTLEPLELLEKLQHIEQKHGRVRKERWGPRTLDLDILLLGLVNMQHQQLVIPHPQIANRSFVLQPLLDLIPALITASGQRKDGIARPIQSLLDSLGGERLLPLDDDLEVVSYS
jgi:2-amino-4-hydroxy-6-hydroxymethyldihydropteridine diphosphokinase